MEKYWQIQSVGYIVESLQNFFTHALTKTTDDANSDTRASEFMVLWLVVDWTLTLLW